MAFNYESNHETAINDTWRVINQATQNKHLKRSYIGLDGHVKMCRDFGLDFI